MSRRLPANSRQLHLYGRHVGRVVAESASLPRGRRIHICLRMFLLDQLLQLKPALFQIVDLLSPNKFVLFPRGVDLRLPHDGPISSGGGLGPLSLQGIVSSGALLPHELRVLD